MPGGFPLFGSFANGSSIGRNATLPAQLTVPVSTNTKSSYTQITASSAADAVAIAIVGAVGGSKATTASLDIAIGAAGFEKIIVADLFLSTSNQTAVADYHGINIFVPVMIPAGSRISARYQASVTALNMFVGLSLFDGGFTGPSSGALTEAIGFTSGSTASTGMTGNGSKGSYSQLIASTGADYAGFFVCLDASAITSGSFGVNAQIDIAVGGAGAEQIILPDYYMHTDNGGGTFQPVVSSFIPLSIPAGSRVSARVATGVADTIGIVLNAVRQ